MHFNDLKRRIPALLDSGVSIELVSAPGRGKSEFVRDTIAALSKRDGKQWGFATCFLATMTPSDLMGYMVPGMRDGVKVSEFTMPPWMLTVDGKRVDQFERGILFLDEFGQGEADVKRASAELLLNRQLGPWKLPDGWSVIAATNRAKDRSGVTKSFDFVINRRAEINITDDLQSWEDWAFSHGVDPTVITFANQNPQIVFSDGVPDKQGPWCTPRSLVMADQTEENVGIDDDLHLFAGVIGPRRHHIDVGLDLHDIVKDGVEILTLVDKQVDDGASRALQSEGAIGLVITDRDRRLRADLDLVALVLDLTFVVGV